MWKGIVRRNRWLIFVIITSCLLVVATGLVFILDQKKDLEKAVININALQFEGTQISKNWNGKTRSDLKRELASFSKHRSIDSIYVYQNKKLIASFQQSEKKAPPVALDDSHKNHTLYEYSAESGYLNIFIPFVLHDKDAVMMIRSQLDSGRHHLKEIAEFMALSVFLVAFFSTRLQKSGSRVINNLIEEINKREPQSDTTSIQKEKSHDELDNLVDSFNEMLGGFEKNKQDLLAEQRQEMDKVINYDALTGLPNRNYLLKNLLPAFLENTECNVCLFVIDISRFKILNENLGHDAADLILKILSQRLSFEFSKIKDLKFADICIAKFTVDEFVVAVKCKEGECNEARWLQCITSCISSPFDVYGKEVFVKVNIGCSHYPADAKEASRLVHAADVALHYAKKDQNADCRKYEKSFSEELEGSFAIEASLRKAIENDELVLYFQPKLNLHTKKVESVEALLRWHHPTLGIITPDKFIPLAETCDLIIEIGQWVIQRACEIGRLWQDEMNADIQIAVNLSQRQFYDPNLMKVIKESLVETGFSHKLLEIEITESVLVVNDRPTRAILEELNQIGISVALDDFGTGYSSLRYLSQLPVDALKIDRSFISGIPGDIKDVEITNTIITLAHNLHKKVTAEGVENVAQLKYLLENNCDAAQGFLIEKALSSQAFMTFYRGFDVSQLLSDGKKQGEV